MSQSKKIAVIGAGISGLTAAYYLSKHHQVSVYDAGCEIGGHTATKDIIYNNRHYAIDTGFIVFNDRTYPNFIQLLNELGVAYQKTQMGFSVSCQKTGIEYSGTSLSGLFAQKSNLLNPQHWKMLRDIMRFNKACIKLHEKNAVPDTLSLGDYLEQENYSTSFRQLYILPMVSAIWSAGNQTAASMPMKFFTRFFYNHGLFTVFNKPQWYTIVGGSRSYIRPLTDPYHERIYSKTPVLAIKRLGDRVEISTDKFGDQRFDEVILACHSDQALSLLTDPTEKELEILSAIPYVNNDVCLHRDISLLPKSKAAWASWNYLNLVSNQMDQTALTYNMNILQNIESDTTFCVSVNTNHLIDPEKIHGKYQYAHPVFNQASVTAQANWSLISGVNHTHYCGAYWRNGFHEDGVVSARRVAQALGVALS